MGFGKKVELFDEILNASSETSRLQYRVHCACMLLGLVVGPAMASNVSEMINNIFCVVIKYKFQFSSSENN